MIRLRALFVSLIVLLTVCVYPTADVDPDFLYLTSYSWELGGINCDNDCGTTALVVTGPELFGWTAACPTSWLGHISTTTVTIWGQEYVCIDSFGHPYNQMVARVKGEYVYRIDIAFDPPIDFPWNNEFVPRGDWSTGRMWMSDFNVIRQQKKEAE